MKDIAIVGSGGVGREVLGLIKSINSVKKEWNIIGFYDDSVDKKQNINGYSVLGGIDELNKNNKELAVVIAIGNSRIREKVFKKLANNNFSFPSLIHPSLIIFDDEFVEIGKGAIIFANVIITTNVVLKDFVFLNNNVNLSHDVIVQDFSTLMSSVSISCKADVGRGCFVGNNTVITKENVLEDYLIVPPKSLFD